MNLSCTQENLYKGLSIVGRTVSVDSALPVLSNVLLKAEKGRLQLSATNLEIGITAVIGAKVEEEGAFTVPARLLTDYVSSLPHGTVDVQLKKNVLHLRLGEYVANIKGMHADEFPLIPTIKHDSVLKCDAQELRNSIGKVAFAATADESRPEISGVLMEKEGENLVLVATDSYRLARKTVRGAAFSKEEFSIIVPAKTMLELHRIIDDSQSKVECSVSENQILFTFDDVELISRLIEGQYPDYKQVIAIEEHAEITVNPKEFLEAVKITSLFSKSGANDIKVEFDPAGKELILSAVSDQVGDNVSRVGAQVKGKPGAVVFNYRFLSDGISNVGQEEMVFRVGAGNGRSIVSSKKDTNYEYIIMPIKQ
jgi:DNA polymerase III subunit beta